MSNVINIDDLHITKKQIISKSGLIKQMVSWSLFCAFFFVVNLAILSTNIEQSNQVIGVVAILTLITLCACCALFLIQICKNIALLLAITENKYVVHAATVLAIKRGSRFGGVRRSSDQLIELSNGMNLVVNYKTRSKFQIGSTAVIVLVHGNEYPIVIENAQSFKMADDNQVNSSKHCF